MQNSKEIDQYNKDESITDDIDDDIDDLLSDTDSDELESSNDEVQPEHKVKQFKKSKKSRIARFIDDEAELSGDDVVSDDEADQSDDDQLDPELVDLDAKDLGSDEEEEVRRLYQKQLDSDDRRQVLLLKEHLEENEIVTGQQRRRKFRWQTKEIMENSLKRHYDPDDDDSQEGFDDEEDEISYSLNRLRRPPEILLSTKLATASSSRVMEPYDDDSQTYSNLDAPRTYSKTKVREVDAGPSILSDESNSNTVSSRLTAQANRTIAQASSDMNRYLYRDKEVVEALSTKGRTVASREEKEQVIQRELKRVIESKSIFDQLYS